MEGRKYGGKQKIYIPDKHQREREETNSNSLAEDLGEDFRLPIDHSYTENLDMENLEPASLGTQLTYSSIGYKLLQKMGWKGKVLAKMNKVEIFKRRRYVLIPSLIKTSTLTEKSQISHPSKKD